MRGYALGSWQLAVVVAAMLAGCSSGSDPLAQSQQAWAVTKRDCLRYHYEITDQSFSGSRWTTTVEIDGDRAITRRFVAENVDGATGTLTVTSTWTETGADIGTHPEGRPARTMEEVYAACARDVVPKDRSQNQVMIQADDRGVLQACWYVPHGCQDDCVSGVVLSEFACGALPDSPDAGSPASDAATDSDAPGGA